MLFLRKKASGLVPDALISIYLFYLYTIIVQKHLNNFTNQ